MPRLTVTAAAAAALATLFPLSAQDVRPNYLPTIWHDFAPWGEHVFEGDIAVRSTYDTNGDGNPDQLFTFRRHSIERIEWDTDFDGTNDLRATYREPADGRSNLQYRLTGHDRDSYRLVPMPTTMHYPAHGGPAYADPTPYYEARVDGAWTDSFEITIAQNRPSSFVASASAIPPMTFVCDSGAAVSLTSPANPDANPVAHPPVNVPYTQTLFENGRPDRTVIGDAPDDISQMTQFTYDQGYRYTTYTDRDEDGGFDDETVRTLTASGAYRTTRRVLIEGEWTGTFTEDGARYVDGLIRERTAYRTDRVVERYTYDDQGALEWKYADSNADGQFDMRYGGDRLSYGDPVSIYRQTMHITAEKWIDGEWVGDFEIEFEGAETLSRQTYRDGRLVHSLYRNAKEGVQRVNEYPAPGVVISRYSQRGMPGAVVWRYYATQPGATGYPLLREAYDHDADDVPDLFIDYQALTISDTRPEGWPE